MKIIITAIAFVVLSGCTKMMPRKLIIDRIDNAYIDKRQNLLVCVNGQIIRTDKVTKKYTVIIPLSQRGLVSLKKTEFTNPVIASTYSFSSKEISAYQLSKKWLRKECIAKEDMTKMKPVKIVSNLLPPKYSHLRYKYKTKEAKQKKDKREARSYLSKMKPGVHGGVVYKIRDSHNRNLNSLIYVAQRPHFNGTNKLGITIAWTEKKASLGAVLVAPLAAYLYSINKISTSIKRH